MIRGQDASVGKRKKMLYTISSPGKLHFANWLRTPADLERNEEALLIKIFFFGLLEEEERRAFAQASIVQLQTMQSRLNSLLQESRQATQVMALPEPFVDVPEFQLATIEFGIAHYKFLERWLKKRFLQ